MQVDFYLYATHEVATAAPILTTLRGWGVDAAFVLEPPGRHLAIGSTPDPSRGWLDRKDARLVPLVDEEMHSTLSELVSASGVPLVASPRRDTTVAITTQGRAWLRRYECALVRLGYGVGLVEDSYGHGDVNRGFDLVLAHGAVSSAAIETSVPGTCVDTVGYPKWASFLRGEQGMVQARARLGLDPSRRTLLYAPTWAHRSSLETMANVIAGLRDIWQVVVKPHHNSLHLERRRLDGLSRHVPDTDVWTRHDLVPYITAADVVITDVVSGAFTESLLARRPVIGLATGTERLLPVARECAPVLTDPSDVPAVLADAPWRRFEESARHWSPALFHQSDGHDDELAAQAVQRCAISRRTRLQRRASNHARAVARRLTRQNARSGVAALPVAAPR